MKLADMKIGCIGTGNMGGAILSRLSEKLNKTNICCFDVDDTKLKYITGKLGINASKDIGELSEISDIIILAVKPDIIPDALKEIRANDKIIISIAAGVSLNTINKNLKMNNKTVRVMPNTPALIGEGMSVISPDAGTDKNTEDIVAEIFSCVGKVLIMPEKLLDAVTALSGCGPAYGFTLIQAMTDGGVKMGIPREKALILASQTILGAAKMVIDSSEEPIILRGKVASPGGSTIEAIHVLEKEGFSGIIMDAIEAAKNKSEKLGK
ncbi:MAG: pyrroline-5-carboxylate reductase [Spirochaetes bacterium]|nr:pyrroline-5-carboxylate reductase [Spirochaetota bacterium]